MSEGGTEREGEKENPKQVPHCLHKPYVGFTLTNCKIMTWAKIKSQNQELNLEAIILTDYATQVPYIFFNFLMFTYLLREREREREREHKWGEGRERKGKRENPKQAPVLSVQSPAGSH